MFSPTFPLLKAGSSSAKWLARQSRDQYVKKRSQLPISYRSRAAFKLLQLDESYSIFDSAVRNEREYRDKLEGTRLDDTRVADMTQNVLSENTEADKSTNNENGVDLSATGAFPYSNRRRRVVVIDLGAAPGGWSQVVSQKFGCKFDYNHVQIPVGESKGSRSRNEPGPPVASDAWSALPAWGAKSLPPLYRNIDPTIIALDILHMSPIPGVKTVRCDFLSPGADDAVSSLLPPDQQKADVILSDIAANVSGNRGRDQAASEEVLKAVYLFASKHLRTMDDIHPGGWLVVKYFPSQYTEVFRNKVLRRSFQQCFISKPLASRADSSEAYFVCKGFRRGVAIPEETDPSIPHSS